MLLRAAAVGVLLLLAAPIVGGAAESICPGGADHNSRLDITWCSDFDTLTNCTTGQETSCWTDNNYASSMGSGPYGYAIVSGGGAVGNGYVRCRPQPGSTGCGSAAIEPVPGFTPRTSAVNFRYYIRYRNGYPSFDNGHNVQFEASGTGTCISALKFQLSAYTGFSYYPYGGSGCKTGSEFVDSINLPANLGQSTTLLNNRWYRIEVQAIMDTSCTDNTVWNGCNGQVRVWIDGTKVTEYTTLNMGGTTHTMRWGWRMLAPEMYYHYGVPPWGFEIDWDNIAVSNNGTQIGAAANENAMGTGDAASPYHNAIPYGAWLGRHAANDCSSSGPAGEYFTYLYRSGRTLDQTVTHGTFVSSCATTIHGSSGIYGIYDASNRRSSGMLVTVTDATSATDCTSSGGGSFRHNCYWNGATDLNPDVAWTFTEAQDTSMKVSLTNASDGGGAYKERPDAFEFPQWVSYGWVYLPSTNNYTVTNLALSGFTSSVSDPTSGYVAVSVSGGNWSVDQKNASGTHGSLVSSTAVTYNAWHEYELILWKNGVNGCASANGCASLMIDRTRVYTVQALPQSAAWAFQVIPANPVPKQVVGVIDFQGTAPFTAYFDDSVVTTASAWSCDGWGAASCPFGGGAKFARGVKLGRGVKVH